jgi:hypothetical protein
MHKNASRYPPHGLLQHDPHQLSAATFAVSAAAIHAFFANSSLIRSAVWHAHRPVRRISFEAGGVTFTIEILPRLRPPAKKKLHPNEPIRNIATGGLPPTEGDGTQTDGDRTARETVNFRAG